MIDRSSHWRNQAITVRRERKVVRRSLFTAPCESGQRRTSGRPFKDIFYPPALLVWVVIGWPDSGPPP